ncbi:ABC transporter substrate-binding protein [Cohnella fermenti]|nr:ABC transporter substrate-binding protein [Cohnella fermenti]
MAYYIFTGTPKDLDLVQDAVNEHLKEKLNVKLKLIPIAFGEYEQKMNLMLTSNEKLDLVVSSSHFGFDSKVAKGQFQPLDELIEKYGQHITEVVDPDVLDASKVNGERYGVPTMRDQASWLTGLLRTDLIEKYSLDTSNIKQLADLEPLLKTVKDNEGYAPFIGSARGALMFDALGDVNFIGVLPNYDNDLKVVNAYDLPEYEAVLKMMRKWYQDGLIPKDAATSKDTAQDLAKANRAFAWTWPGKPGIAQQESLKASREVVSFPLNEYPAITTASAQSVMWSIPQQSEHPDKAMQVLDLLYTDKELIDLLNWGIEGKHYVKATDLGDNMIRFPDGVDATNSGYNINVGYFWGNQFISYVFEGDDPKLWEEMDNFNKSALKSKALGFVFDVTPVTTEYAAVSSVVGQYRNALEVGAVDPEVVLPEFRSRLKEAGVDKIIAEKQKQLDAWAQANK